MGRSDVEDQQVVVGPAGKHVQPLAHERFGQGPGVGDDLVGVRRELGPECLGKRHGLGRHHVRQRPAQHEWAAPVNMLFEFVGTQAPGRPAGRAGSCESSSSRHAHGEPD